MIYRVPLPYERPPMNLNDRIHYRTKAKQTAKIRLETAIAAREVLGASLSLERIKVYLEWTVPDKRRRDADNPIPTLKAACDGLVDAGIVPDDTPEFMDKRMTDIKYEKGAKALFLIIEVT